MKATITTELRKSLAALFLVAALGAGTGGAAYALMDEELLQDKYSSLSEEDARSLRKNVAAAGGGVFALGIFGAYGIGRRQRIERESDELQSHQPCSSFNPPDHR